MSSPAANKWTNIIILCILIAGAYFRATIYGDLRLSVGMPDTGTYIKSSNSSLLSWQAFTDKRLFTTNLLYKLAPSQECANVPFSAPATGKEFHRKIQPCFNQIAIVQNILSIVCWCALAWVVARRLTRPIFKILAAILILTYSFTPQIAEWDSVLSSESISLSLFAALFALLIEIAFLIAGKDGQFYSARTSAMLILWLAVFALWMFVRDVNLLAALTTIFLAAPLLLTKRIRENKTFVVTLILLFVLFLLGSVSARQSSRQRVPLSNSFTQYIFPHPARVEYFEKSGMPADRAGAEYKVWFKDQAATTYLKFLINHPGFVGATLLESLPYFQMDFLQPYYKSPEFASRNLFIQIGEIVHPRSNAVFIVDLLLLIALYAAAFNNKDGKEAAWAWLATWLLLYSSASLFLSFFGDADGVTRHIFPAVESFRLFMWIFLIAQIDLSAGRH